MALGNEMGGGDPDGSSDGPSQPFAYVLIPILGFGLIVSVFTCYKYKRRKARLARMAAEDITFVRDPETGRTRLDRRGPNGAVTGRRRAGRRLGLGVGSREEGLNELGEAPPAYTPNAPKPPSESGGMELMTYSQATAEIGTSRSPPGYGQESSAGRAGGSTIDGGLAGADHIATRSSQELRRDIPGDAMAYDTSERTRLSQEIRRYTPANTSTADEITRRSEESRRNVSEIATTRTTGGVSDNMRLDEDVTRDTPQTARSASQSTRPSEEMRRDTTENTIGTTSTTSEAANTITTAPSTADEPLPPPKAVLPPALGGD